MGSNRNKIILIISLIVVIVGIPLINNLNLIMPYSYNLWFKGDLKYFNVFWLSSILLQIFSFILVLVLIKINGFSIRDLGYFLSVSKTKLLVFILSCVFLAIFGLATFLNQKNLPMICFVPNSTLGLFLYCTSLIIASICEEFVFRAFSIKFLNQLRTPMAVSIIITSIAFAVNHGFGAVHNYIQYFIFGVLMSIIFIWSKKIIPCIIAHMSYNLFTLFYCFT